MYRGYQKEKANKLGGVRRSCGCIRAVEQGDGQGRVRQKSLETVRHHIGEFFILHEQRALCLLNTCTCTSATHANFDSVDEMLYSQRWLAC